MSGLIKGIKKVFKRVGKVLKKIAKPVAIAVAVYFTAGLALSAFPATAGFAASMPGFAGGGFLGTGVGAGATAGTGIFSQAATAIGLGGGLQTGAAAASGVAAGAPSLSAVTGSGLPSLSSVMAGTTGATAAGATTAAAGGAAAAGMSLTNKLLLAKVGTDVAGALFGPTQKEVFEASAIEKAKFRGAFYGQDAGGAGNIPSAAGPPAPPVGGAATQPGRGAPPAQPTGAVPEQPPANTVSPQQQQLLDGRDTKSLFPTQRQAQTGQSTGPGAMKQNIPIPEGLFSASPDVRYV